MGSKGLAEQHRCGTARVWRWLGRSAGAQRGCGAEGGDVVTCACALAEGARGVVHAYLCFARPGGLRGIVAERWLGAGQVVVGEGGGAVPQG